MFLCIPFGEVEHGHDRFTETVALQGKKERGGENDGHPDQYFNFSFPLHGFEYLLKIY